jgi:hypothetical protein
MKRLKKVAVCSAVVALMGAFSAPAMADRFPEGPGQPITSGQFEDGTAVIHCQAAMEFLISVGLFPPSDAKYPGVILIKQNAGTPPTVRSVGPRPCPAIVFFQG